MRTKKAPNVVDLLLTSPQVIEAVAELEDERLIPQTLAYWASAGIAVPTDWPKKRGRYTPRRYTMGDLARVRLVVKLRAAGVSMGRVRSILATIEAELPELLWHRSPAELRVDGWRGVIAKRPGKADVSLPDGSPVLRFADLIDGNAEAARRVSKSA